MGMHRKSAVAAGLALLFGVGTVGGLAAANGNRTNLRADLSGANEVAPAFPADPDGDGRARVEVNVESGEVCFSIRFNDTGTPNRGHIHVGMSGVSGGIVRPAVRVGGCPG